MAEEDREKVVIDKTEVNHTDHVDRTGPSAGVIIAIVILVLIVLFFLFGGANIFSGGGSGTGGGTTNVNVTPGNQ